MMSGRQTFFLRRATAAAANLRRPALRLSSGPPPPPLRGHLLLLQTAPVRHYAAAAGTGTSATKSANDYITHHSLVSTPTETCNFIDNRLQRSQTDRWIDLRDPATQQPVTRVPETTHEEMLRAVHSAERAFGTWKKTSLLSRQQILFRLAALIRENWDRLAASITLEQVRPVPPTLPIPRGKRSPTPKATCCVACRSSKPRPQFQRR
jgi:Aldehyde dehydrogenase family